MKVQLSKRLVSVEDYHKMFEAGIITEEDKIELLHGDIIHMSPIGSRHVRCVDRLMKMLVRQIDDPDFVSVQSPIKVSAFSEPEPDLMVIRGPEERFEEVHPRAEDVIFLIEVADTSLQKDQQVKLPLYAESGVPMVWIVNVLAKEIEVHSKPDQQAYMQRNIYRKGAVITLSDLNLEVPVDSVFPD